MDSDNGGGEDSFGDNNNGYDHDKVYEPARLY